MNAYTFGRSPCGERGLKSCVPRFFGGGARGRSPCGERGLKLSGGKTMNAYTFVAPRAGSVG